jgi:hypothetical protein
VVIFQSDKNSNEQFYLGAKGGKASTNHGNMDAGSFVFELNGVRWSVDPGNQNYNELEQTGFNLWGRCQNCERWTLLTKNNFGHSTITINEEIHQVDGFAPIIDFKEGTQPEATFDLSKVYGGKIKSITRRLVKESNSSLLIEDKIENSDSTRLITWQMITQASVELVSGGAKLKQNDKELFIQNISHPDLAFSIISLDPPPLKLDRKIEGLKRIELRIPAYLFENGKGEIIIKLASN